jgi:hypothetical protein
MSGPTATTTPRTFVVDHYRPGLNADELRQLAEGVRDAAVEMGRAGKPIRCVSSTVVPEDDYFQTVFEAKSERLVREAHARAGISFERISVAIPVDDVPSGPIHVAMTDAPPSRASVSSRSSASHDSRRGRASKEGS